MEIRKRIENNPIVYVVTTAVAVAGLAVAVVAFLCRERIEIIKENSELTVKTLQTELASIRRGLGESQSVDIRTFLYPKGGGAAIRPISPKAQYVAGDDFYANLNLPGWKHGVMDGERLTRSAFGNESFDRAPLAFQKALKDSRAHVWSPTSGVMRIKVRNAEGDLIAERSGPFITIQKVPIAETVGLIGKYLPDLEDPITGQKITAGDVKTLEDSAVHDLDELFRGDAAGLFLGNLAMQHFADITSPSYYHFRTQLAEVQKVGNVLYVQFFMTLVNAEVDGKIFPRFFIREEFIFVTDHASTTAIEVIVPSADPSPRGPVYAEIQEWFSTLAIPVS